MLKYGKIVVSRSTFLEFPIIPRTLSESAKSSLQNRLSRFSDLARVITNEIFIPIARQLADESRLKATMQGRQ